MLLLLLMLMLLLVYYRSPQGTDTTWATCQSTYGGGEKSSKAERFSSASIPGDLLLLVLLLLLPLAIALHTLNLRRYR